MLKKIALVFLSLTFLFTAIFTPIVQAQESQPWYMTDFKQWYTKVYDTNVSPPQEIFGERYTAAQVQWVFYSIPSMMFNAMSGLVGGDEDLVLCIMNNDISDCTDALIDEVESIWNIFSTVLLTENNNGSFFASVFSEKRAFSGVNYMKGKIAGAHLVPEVEAQGFGFSALGPVQSAWRTFRDVSYGFFIIIIIVMAFMIMFRLKISPQTVITVQSALPKVILALILVTFSYAIAGFLIDLMYVIIGILAYIVKEASILPVDEATWSGVFTILTDGPANLGVLGWIVLYWMSFMWGSFVAWYSSLGAANLFAAAIGLVLGFLAFIVAFISVLLLLWWTIKIVLMLLKAYIMLLIQVIFAPFIITFGVLSPQGGVGGWIRNIVSNLAVFPLTGAMFVIAFYFVRSMWGGILGDNLVWNPWAGDAEIWYPPLLFGSPTGDFNPLPLLFTYASLGIVALIPHATDIVKGAIEGKPFAYGAAIGQALGEGWTAARGLTWDSRTMQTIRNEAAETRAIRLLEWYGKEDNLASRAIGRFSHTLLGRQLIPPPDETKDLIRRLKKRKEV
ncbi:MAG: hypothetical protein PVJ52_00025 [Candidatus Woesebacteria bacterium]|jgi:hypothetical protein